jgi:hypothetical protein
MSHSFWENPNLKQRRYLGTFWRRAHIGLGTVSTIYMPSLTCARCHGDGHGSGIILRGTYTTSDAMFFKRSRPTPALASWQSLLRSQCTGCSHTPQSTCLHQLMRGEYQPCVSCISSIPKSRRNGFHTQFDDAKKWRERYGLGISAQAAQSHVWHTSLVTCYSCMYQIFPSTNFPSLSNLLWSARSEQAQRERRVRFG